MKLKFKIKLMAHDLEYFLTVYNTQTITARLLVSVAVLR